MLGQPGNLSGRRDCERNAAYRPSTRGALFVAAVLVAIAAHLGAVLVWGADFLSR
jgi:hypothetical protein